MKLDSTPNIYQNQVPLEGVDIHWIVGRSRRVGRASYEGLGAGEEGRD
jgi:hypothetical protein